ncbi:MAG: hypothetical protein SPH93_10465 [Clostridium sp.]|nr:hypothetical protein [Clostridium sp.]MDY6228070.1 hypothetical protein [Clostridium sp.]
MIKIKVSYENEAEKLKILEAFKKEKNKQIICKPSKVKGYYKMYIDIE